jgi:hypothetical protein
MRTRRWRLGTVVGAADSASGEHRGAGGVLEEAKARPEEDQRGPPTVECPAGKKKVAARAEGIDGYGSDTRRGSRRSGRRDARDRCGARGG